MNNIVFEEGHVIVYEVGVTGTPGLKDYYWVDKREGEQQGPFDHLSEALSNWSGATKGKKRRKKAPVAPKVPDNVIQVDFAARRRVG